MNFNNKIEFYLGLKYKCVDCDSVYRYIEALIAEHPFNRKEIVIGCPECCGLNNGMACQVVNCKRMSQAGINHDGRYRHVCASHYLDIRSNDD